MLGMNRVKRMGTESGIREGSLEDGMKILILSKKDHLALYIMRCLSDLKAEIHIFGQGSLWMTRMSKYCRGYVRCDFGTPEFPNDFILDRINNYCLKHKISLVVAADYDTNYFFSRVKSRLAPGVIAFPTPAPGTLETLHDKWKFAELLESLKLPYPRTVLVENVEQLKAVDMKFPRLVKPLHCEGGHPLKYVKQSKEDYLASGQLSLNFPLLVQEFIPGRDIGLCILARRGKIVAWAMQEYINPYTLQFFTSKKLLDLGRRVVEATNYEGVVDFDLRIDERDNSFKFIECNPRFWNTLRASRRNGVNFIVLGLMLAHGKEIPSENISKNIHYIFLGRVFGELKRGRMSILKNIPQSTKEDLRQMIFDPLSCICSCFLKQL
jgi:predicted ATP-grasp superfamily ATP-dependent carboligase